MDLGVKSNFKNILDSFFSQITELGSMTISLIIIAVSFFYNKSLAEYLLIGTIAITIIAILIKALFFQHRPKKQKFTTLIERLDASSFPSIHSARIAGLVFWLIVYSNSIILTIILTITASLVAYSRIYLRKHYFRDVIAGVLLAFLTNIIIYYIA